LAKAKILGRQTTEFPARTVSAEAAFAMEQF
jgi:hypothetical protein